MSSTLPSSHDENETYQISTLEPTNAENIVRGCNHCLHVAKIPHPSIHIQSPKPDSSRTQLYLTTPDTLEPVIPDVVQRRERKDQDIIPHEPPGLDGLSLVSRSILRRRRTGD
ncbi:hypothetical protein ACTXT7_008678 [Hymenolepis weldensis]